jgi:hypothetical protein
MGPEFVDAKDVWEHLHPALPDDLGIGWALSIDPRDGTVWGANGIRTTYVVGYGPNLSNQGWGMGFEYDVWPDVGDPEGPTRDNTRSISHCPDGTLWMGSTTHGLARLDPNGAISHVDAAPQNVLAVACDPSDSSVWMGLTNGGILRLKDGQLHAVETTGVPAFARQPVQSIQIDRWSSPRVLYFAFAATKDDTGAITASGGVAAYDGP